MSLGILQAGPGRPVSDGVLGSAMVYGPGAAYRSGSLGEYFDGPVAGLGCATGTCGAMGEEGISVPTSMVLGVAIGAGLMYLFGKELLK